MSALIAGQAQRSEHNGFRLRRVGRGFCLYRSQRSGTMVSISISGTVLGHKAHICVCVDHIEFIARLNHTADNKVLWLSTKRHSRPASLCCELRGSSIPHVCSLPPAHVQTGSSATVFTSANSLDMSEICVVAPCPLSITL